MKKVVTLALLVVFTFSLLSAAPGKSDIKYGAYTMALSNAIENGLLEIFSDDLSLQLAYASYGSDYAVADETASSMALTLTYYTAKIKGWDAGLTLRYASDNIAGDSFNNLGLGGSIKREITDWLGVKADAFLMDSKSGVDTYKGSAILPFAQTRIALYTMF